jgi:predicted nucleotidyltransferase
MINKESWMKKITEKLKNHFGDRLLFVGLQGSYVRGEQTEKSDFDVVVVLDKLEMPDLVAYRKMVDAMPEPGKACGFIGGREQLRNWPKYDLLQFAKETEARYGALDGILPPVTVEDVKESVKIGAANIYHFAAHTFVHAPKESLPQAARGLYKAAAFVIQTNHYAQTGQYITSKTELLPKLSGAEKEILALVLDKSDKEETPEQLFSRLIDWAGELVKN